MLPAIILVEPQLAENIGTAARAMANFGLRELRLVNPRETFPSEKARAAASGADDVIDAAKVFATTEEAIADLGFVLATTARVRELAMEVAGPRRAAAQLRELCEEGKATGVLFGRERSGLTNDELSLADALVTLPVDPAHASLNVAQAVLIIAYEWRRSGLVHESEGLPFAGPDAAHVAPKEDLLRLFEHLEGSLDAAGFFRPPEKRPHTVRSLRILLQRARLTEQEVRMLRGVIAALEARPTRPIRSRSEAGDAPATPGKKPA
ncbi:MAG: RNA methyltransferase [Bauldia sp.]